jgi:hypothetical protein
VLRCLLIPRQFAPLVTLRRHLRPRRPAEEEEEGEEEEGSLGLAALLPPGLRRDRAPKVDLKARMSNILSQDREDAIILDSSSGGDE